MSSPFFIDPLITFGGWKARHGRRREGRGLCTSSRTILHVLIGGVGYLPSLLMCLDFRIEYLQALASLRAAGEHPHRGAKRQPTEESPPDLVAQGLGCLQRQRHACGRPHASLSAPLRCFPPPLLSLLSPIASAARTENTFDCDTGPAGVFCLTLKKKSQNTLHTHPPVLWTKPQAPAIGQRLSLVSLHSLSLSLARSLSAASLSLAPRMAHTRNSSL